MVKIAYNHGNLADVISWVISLQTVKFMNFFISSPFISYIGYLEPTL